MIIYNYPTSFNEPIVGGAIKNPFYLSQMLKKRGMDITVITYKPNKDKKDKEIEVFNGIKVHIIGQTILKGVFRSLILSFNEAKELLMLLKREDFDIIHTHTFSIMGLAILRRLKKISIPILSTAHGTSLPETIANLEKRSFYSILAKIDAYIEYYIDQYSWLNFDKVISAGYYQVREMIDIYKLPKEKVIPIPNGVDISFYKPDPKAGNKIKEKYEIENKRIVLFVGRLVKKKGLQYLINSAPIILRKIPDIVFLIVGGTDKFAQYESELKKLIKHLNLEEKFIIVKNVPEKDMPSYYNAADVCVVPSINYEPLPTVVFEAMACGKPVVASNLGGIPEQLGYDYTLVPPKNSKELAKKIIEILQNDDLYITLSKRNRKRAREFDWVEIAKKHIKIYKELINQGSIIER